MTGDEFKKANELFRKKHYKGAINIYRRLIRNNGELFVYLDGLSLALARVNEGEEAKTTCGSSYEARGKLQDVRSGAAKQSVGINDKTSNAIVELDKLEVIDSSSLSFYRESSLEMLLKEKEQGGEFASSFLKSIIEYAECALK